MGIVKLYSENVKFHWILNNNSNNDSHFLNNMLYFVYGWSVVGLMCGFLALPFYQ